MFFVYLSLIIARDVTGLGDFEFDGFSLMRAICHCYRILSVIIIWWWQDGYEWKGGVICCILAHSEACSIGLWLERLAMLESPIYTSIRFTTSPINQTSTHSPLEPFPFVMRQTGKTRAVPSNLMKRGCVGWRLKFYLWLVVTNSLLFALIAVWKHKNTALDGGSHIAIVTFERHARMNRRTLLNWSGLFIHGIPPELTLYVRWINHVVRLAQSARWSASVRKECPLCLRNQSQEIELLFDEENAPGFSK